MGIENTLHEMLKPYYPECRYLVEAELNFPTIKGRFAIPKTFYGAQSGHFNATELMICYNQICYTFFAEAFDQGLFKSVDRISLEEFKKYQLGNSYIARIDKLKFSKPINPKDFYGKITLNKTRRFNNTAFFSTEFEFSDKNGGEATGNTLIAIVLKEQAELPIAV